MVDSTVVAEDGRAVPRWSIVDAPAPPERLAALRAVTAGFAVAYLLLRLPVFLRLADRDPADLEPVGVISLLDSALPDAVLVVLVVLAPVVGAAAALGWHYRLSGPAFAIVLLAIVSYRSSWGQLLHFEHLMVVFALLLALAPAADAWSLDARRRRRSEDRLDAGGDGAPDGSVSSVRYGWPIRLCALAVVVTYVIAGIAKLRYGGLDWVVGDTLRNHIAYAATRLELLGGDPSPLAGPAVRAGAVLPAFAFGTVVVELAAPVALLGGRWRDVWVVATWLMHVGILALMLIGFPSPLFGVAFAPFFALEVGVRRISARRRGTGGVLGRPGR